MAAQDRPPLIIDQVTGDWYYDLGGGVRSDGLTSWRVIDRYAPSDMDGCAVCGDAIFCCNHPQPRPDGRKEETHG